MRLASRVIVLSATALLAAGVLRTIGADPKDAKPTPEKPMKVEDLSKLSDAELRAKLTPEQYRICKDCGTEPPFRNAYWNHKEAGVYVDVISGEPLFASVHKFDSGTGWPSFWKPLKDEAVVKHEDKSLGVVRVEVKSKKSDAHLGHVFEDGPQPTGLRYCINSAALKFVPADKLKEAGLEQFQPLFEGQAAKK